MANGTKKAAKIEGIDESMLPALAEVGFLAAAVDGKLGDTEGEVLTAVLQAAFGEEVTEEQINALIVDSARAVTASSMEARIALLKASLTTQVSRLAALSIAASVMLSEEGVVEEEGTLYGYLAGSLDISKEEAISLFKHVAAQMKG